MARVFSDMSAAGPLPVQCAFLYLLQLLAEYICRPHRRGCLHARFPWEDSFGSGAADHSQLPCNCHQMFLRLEGEEGNAACQTSRALCRFHATMTTFNVGEEDGAYQNMASWNSRTTMFNSLLDYMDWLRSKATVSRADLCAWVCRREDGDGITLEGSGENFDGIACSSPDVEESTPSRKRATTNGHRRPVSERLTDDDVELYTSTCQDDRYRLPGNNRRYSTWDESVLRFCLNIARHELDRDYSHRNSIDHDDLWNWSPRISVDNMNLWDWSRLSLWCTFGDLDFNDVFSEHWSRRLWQDYYSSEEIPVQHDVSHDWKEQSCIYSTDAVSELHDGSCLDQDRVASSLTQLGGSICTTGQSVSSDDVDDCESMNSSITTEELLARQPDSNEEMEVSMPQEQASETAGNGSEGTSWSTPWWYIPGFRFLPTDKEIALHYLKRKVMDRRLPVHHAVEEGHNVYALDADDMTLDGKYGDKERLGFFFVNKQESYCNGCYYRTPDGYWRIRGRPALVRHRGRTIAFKTAMDFHRGRPPHGCRTPWSMFEYALNGCHVDLLNLEQPWMNAYVVCKVRRRESKTSAREERWRRPGLLPKRPFVKKISPRRFRPEMIIVPEAEVVPKRNEEDPSLVVEEPIVYGKYRRPLSIF